MECFELSLKVLKQAEKIKRWTFRETKAKLKSVVYLRFVELLFSKSYSNNIAEDMRREATTKHRSYVSRVSGL